MVRWTIGVALLLASAIAWRLAYSRLAAANPHSRLPYVRRPENNPAAVQRFTAFAVGLMVAGIGWLGGDSTRYRSDMWWGTLAGCVGFMLACGIPVVRHNRRVAAETRSDLT